MNITDLRELEFTTKQEGNGSTSDDKIISKPNFTTSSWSRLKDPRIVRVSRAFGGKDRHSKVCTVRGLRDRRVRLSVPTAIQLYDLQDRLGLNQPSKVVDWLLNAAKHEIDELPPLQMPPGNFGQGLQAMLSTSSHHAGVISTSQSEKFEGVKTTGNSLNWEDYWNPNKSKEVARETSDGQEGGDQEEGNKHDDGTFVQSSNFFARNNQPSSLPGLLNNVIPNGSFIRWDPSNLSLSQFGSYGSMANHQTEDAVHNFNMNVAALPSMPSGSQLLVYPTPPQTQSYFPSHGNSSEFDPKQLNFQMLSSSSSSQQPLSSSSNFTPPLYMVNQGMRPFHLSMNPKLFPSGDEDVNEPNKGN